MTLMRCDYPGNRDEAIVAYLYGDVDAADRAVFEEHLEACAACRDEVSEFTNVRARLGRWLPPEALFLAPRLAGRKVHGSGRRWLEIPAWAQVAAALLFLGAAAGIANLDARYDRGGLTVRTGWTRQPAVVGRPAESP